MEIASGVIPEEHWREKRKLKITDINSSFSSGWLTEEKGCLLVSF